MNEAIIKTVKDFRLTVDGLMALHFQYIKGDASAYVSLKMAKAWMGKILEGLDVPTPYKNDGKRNKTEDIEPTADTKNAIDAIIKAHPDPDYKLLSAFICSDVLETEDIYKKEGNFQYFSDLNKLQQVDWMREQIKKTTIAFLRMPPVKGIVMEKVVTNVYTHLCEARFHLGFELQNMKEIHDRAVMS